MTSGPTHEDAWRSGRLIADLSPYTEEALAIFREIRRAPDCEPKTLRRILRRHPRDGHNFFSKNLLVRLYLKLTAEGALSPDEELLRRLRMKPVRTLSGVAPVTVLTAPHPCPGECLFCPTEPGMPKSYLADEPGAQRALQNRFDPHAQVENRLRAFHTNGHPVDKCELLILGGSWSCYPADYQDWFVRRCLEALNEEASPSLEEAQTRNETAPHRNTGLVVETRPDLCDAAEIRRLRRQGVTKVQLGAQSLDDRILRLSRRGHDVEATRRAMTLLRAAGLKQVLHWMPNLLGSDPACDLEDFSRLWSDPALRPDEIKIYPCALLPGTGYYELWERGQYKPYSEEVLRELVASCKSMVPSWCRINRVHRDIPSTRIVEGNRRSNLREDVLRLMAARGLRCRCIRCREVRGLPLGGRPLALREDRYETRAGEEVFLSLVTSSATGTEDILTAYLRLSFPLDPPDLGIEEIRGAALVRELHVKGQAMALGRAAGEEAQHRGLGGKLLEEAARRSRERGFGRLAVIASVGTRGYYRARGFELQGTYMVRAL